MAQEWNVESSAPQSSPHAGSCPSGTDGQAEAPWNKSPGKYVLAQDTHPSAEWQVHTLKESLPLLVTSEDRVPSFARLLFPPAPLLQPVGSEAPCTGSSRGVFLSQACSSEPQERRREMSSCVLHERVTFLK